MSVAAFRGDKTVRGQADGKPLNRQRRAGGKWLREVTIPLRSNLVWRNSHLLARRERKSRPKSVLKCVRTTTHDVRSKPNGYPAYSMFGISELGAGTCKVDCEVGLTSIVLLELVVRKARVACLQETHCPTGCLVQREGGKVIAWGIPRQHRLHSVTGFFIDSSLEAYYHDHRYVSNRIAKRTNRKRREADSARKRTGRGEQPTRRRLETVSSGVPEDLKLTPPAPTGLAPTDSVPADTAAQHPANQPTAGNKRGDIPLPQVAEPGPAAKRRKYQQELAENPGSSERNGRRDCSANVFETVLGRDQ